MRRESGFKGPEDRSCPRSVWQYAAATTYVGVLMTEIPIADEERRARVRGGLEAQRRFAVRLGMARQEHGAYRLKPLLVLLAAGFVVKGVRQHRHRQG